MDRFDVDATVVVKPDAVSGDLAGDTAILHLKSGTYFTLNATGTTVWKLIQQPTRVSEVHRSLLERYEIDPETCAADLQALIGDLLEHGLVEIVGHAADR